MVFANRIGSYERRSSAFEISISVNFCRYYRLEHGGKCRTKLVHGFHFRKVTAGLNEPLKSIAQVFATDHQLRVNNFDCTCAQQLLELMG